MFIANVLGAVSVVAAVVLGVGVGAYLPFRVCADAPGFGAGMLFGTLFALTASMLAAQLFGGWGEELFGTYVGVPVGVFVGCFIGMATSCFIFGVVGVLVGRLFRR